MYLVKMWIIGLGLAMALPAAAQKAPAANPVPAGDGSFPQQACRWFPGT